MAFQTCARTVAILVPVGLTGAAIFGPGPAFVAGHSMQPTFNPNVPRSRKCKQDCVYLSRKGLKNYKFKRGEIVSIVSPHDPSAHLIKRIVGLEGDTVKTLTYKQRYVTVPHGQVWLEGDNHACSSDSNAFGPVPMGLIRARAVSIIWPYARRQKLDSELPPETLKRINCDVPPSVSRLRLAESQTDSRSGAEKRVKSAPAQEIPESGALLASSVPVITAPVDSKLLENPEEDIEAAKE